MEVRGPIIREERLEKTESFKEKTFVKNKATGEEFETDSRNVTHTDRSVLSRHFDYENYNPYYKRFLKGDEDALGEYYVKYWPK